MGFWKRLFGRKEPSQEEVIEYENFLEWKIRQNRQARASGSEEFENMLVTPQPAFDPMERNSDLIEHIDTPMGDNNEPVPVEYEFTDDEEPGYALLTVKSPAGEYVYRIAKGPMNYDLFEDMQMRKGEDLTYYSLEEKDNATTKD